MTPNSVSSEPGAGHLRGRRVPAERPWHDHPHRDQHLYRRDHGQCRRAGGERLDRQLGGDRQQRCPARWHRHGRRGHDQQRRHVRSRQLARHDDRRRQFGVPVGRALPRAGQYREWRGHQRDRRRQRGARRHGQRSVRVGKLCDAHFHHPLSRGRARRDHVRCFDDEQSAGRLHSQSELHRHRRDPQPHRHPGARHLRIEHQPAQRRHRAQQLLQQRRCAAARLRKRLRSHRRQPRQRALPALRRSCNRRPASRIPAHQSIPRTDARSLRRRQKRRCRRRRPGARFCAGTRSAAR